MNDERYLVHEMRRLSAKILLREMNYPYNIGVANDPGVGIVGMIHSTVG